MDAKVWIGLGVFAAGLATLGIYEHYKGGPAATVTGAATGNLAPGTMAGLTFSASACTSLSCPSVTYSPPSGASISSAAQSGGSTTIQVSYSATSATLTAMAASPVGSATVNIVWTDSSGNVQTSTVPVNVTA